MSDRKTISPKLRDKLLREAGYRCANPPCRTTLALHLHHMIEVCEGGGDTMENLIALCPTCHSLFHAGIISRDAISEWKSRLLKIYQIDASQSDLSSTSGESRRGFSLASAEFSWRTCEIGLLHKTRFKTRGLCTFVSDRVAITTNRVVDDILGHSPQFGSPSIWTKLGMAPFEVGSRFNDLGLSLLKMGIIDDGYTQKLMGTNESLKQFFAPPLQTPVRFRLVPFVGEHVGILHAPPSTKALRGTNELQFEESAISYVNKMGPGKKFLQVTSSPMAVRIVNEGAPVFTADARFIGIVLQSIEIEGEAGWRHVISNLIPLKSFFERDKHTKADR